MFGLIVRILATSTTWSGWREMMKGFEGGGHAAPVTAQTHFISEDPVCLSLGKKNEGCRLSPSFFYRATDGQALRIQTGADRLTATVTVPVRAYRYRYCTSSTCKGGSGTTGVAADKNVRQKLVVMMVAVLHFINQLNTYWRKVGSAVA
jgi:hypothetical protein